MIPKQYTIKQTVVCFRYKLWVTFFVMLLTVSLFALDETDEEVGDLSLGDIFDLDVEVTVASKKAEKISDAPGVIIAYTDKDMENLGYYTIRDLANLTSGYSSFRSIGEITLETRGQKTAGFDNNKHLLLVDGIPVRHVRAGKAPVEEEISLFGMKRVGAAETVKTVAGFDDWNDRNAIFINTNYSHKSGFSLGGIYSKKTGGMGEFWGSESSIFNDITWEILIPYVKFAKGLSDVLSVNSYLLINQSTEKTFQDPGYTEVSVNWWEMKLINLENSLVLVNSTSKFPDVL